MVQDNQLKQWKSILKEEKFRMLQLWIKRENSELFAGSTGYDVVRGTEIDNWIQNNLMER